MISFQLDSLSIVSICFFLSRVVVVVTPFMLVMLPRRIWPGRTISISISFYPMPSEQIITTCHNLTASHCEVAGMKLHIFDDNPKAILFHVGELIWWNQDQYVISARYVIQLNACYRLIFRANHPQKQVFAAQYSQWSHKRPFGLRIGVMIIPM